MQSDDDRHQTYERHNAQPQAPLEDWLTLLEHAQRKSARRHGEGAVLSRAFENAKTALMRSK